MKLFPLLFQFASPRFSGADNVAATTNEASGHQQSARHSLFVSFRSPNDQQCVIAVPSYRVDHRSKAGTAS
ncbi:MAG TPA: hypothetical protein VK768_05735 [Chthoniobacterales bacterium]|nr:hypothetical protein [Chthoniobacterales bacterium]